MSGSPAVALDTSYVIALLKGAVTASYRLADVAFPFAVIGELRFGALNGRDPQQKLAELDGLTAESSILAADQATAHTYAELRHQLRLAGMPLPENDIWIAACCIQHALPLLTLDEHFQRVPGLNFRSS